MPPEIALADLLDVTIDTVNLVTIDGEILRFRAFDPTIDTDERELDITFFGVRAYVPSERLGDVRLKETTLPAEFTGAGVTAFEFVHREIRPTQGRPYQAEVLENGTSRILYGEEIEQRRALIVAERVLITVAAPE